MAVDPGAHGPPALQRRGGVVGRVQRLVARDVQEQDLGPVERIDRPPVEARRDQPEPMLEVIDERGARDAIGVAQRIPGECPDLVQQARR